ncbi:MAG: hypothetical protein LBJ73_01175 [Rickettsiales bacterium]|nr:hypothetical protein [Rickettsiales bacterium]
MLYQLSYLADSRDIRARETKKQGKMTLSKLDASFEIKNRENWRNIAPFWLGVANIQDHESKHGRNSHYKFSKAKQK